MEYDKNFEGKGVLDNYLELCKLTIFQKSRSSFSNTRFTIANSRFQEVGNCRLKYFFNSKQRPIKMYVFNRSLQEGRLLILSLYNKLYIFGQDTVNEVDCFGNLYTGLYVLNKYWNYRCTSIYPREKKKNAELMWRQSSKALLAQTPINWQYWLYQVAYTALQTANVLIQDFNHFNWRKLSLILLQSSSSRISGLRVRIILCLICTRGTWES